MIANSTELKVAVRNLRIMEEALAALQTQLEESNPKLYEVSSQAYLRRITALQEEIAAYLAQHPAEVSLILPPIEQAVASVMPPPSSTP